MLLVIGRLTVLSALGTIPELAALAVSASGSLLALFVAQRRLPHALDLRPLLLGLALTAVGVWIAVAAQDRGLATSSIVANLLIAIGVLVMCPVIFPAFYRGMTRRQAASTAIDGLILLTAGATVLLALWLTRAAVLPEPVEYLLPVLSVLLPASALTAVLAAFTSRIALQPRGIWASIVGLTILGLCWVVWLDRMLRLDTPGPLLSSLYSVGAVVISYGWITWTFEPAGGARYTRLASSLADWLPLMGILGCLSVVVYPHGRVRGVDPAVIGTAAVILLSIARQRLLVLAERGASDRLAIELAERAQVVAGAQSHLSESLAQELVGSLGLELREFLVRVSPVDEIDPTIASRIAGLPEERTRTLLAAAQHLGLLSHGEDPGEPWRLNPIVTEYLQARLASEVGRQGVIDLHRRLATTLEATSWRQAARHWAAAGDFGEMRRVIRDSILTIVARGDFAAALDLVTRFPEPGPAREPAYALLKSYEIAGAGRYAEASAAVARIAEQLGPASPSDPLRLAVALTRIRLAGAIGGESLLESAVDDLRNCGDTELETIARTLEWQWERPETAPLTEVCAALSEVVRLAAQRDHARLEGLALVRLATAQAGLSDWPAAVESGRRAVARLEAHGMPDELARARLALARALAPCTSGRQWRQQASIALRDKGGWAEPEILAGLAELEALAGDPEEARRIVSLPLPETVPALSDRPLRLARARVELVEGDPAAAIKTLTELDRERPLALQARSVVAAARALLSPADPNLRAELAAMAEEAARREQWYLQRSLLVTLASVSDPEALNRQIHALESETAQLAGQAELVTRRLADLDPASFDLVRRDAAMRPERWRGPVRRQLEQRNLTLPEAARATELLELVGAQDDIELLHRVAQNRRLKLPEAGRNLAKRLAPAVYVDDLGRISIRVGDRVVDGTDVRRKVLALLAYLLTRPRFTATRDETIEALWPDTDLEQGINSVNQACHVLRQVFEPTAERGVSSGYLNNKADLIWLDDTLVSSRSGECLRLLSALEGDPSPDVVRRLVATYTGPFALDFLYEDWASTFRDRLHSSFLAQVEHSIDRSIEARAYQEAINLAEKTLAVDPTAEQIELLLVRLYRLIGATGAASRQYAHYAAFADEQREA